MESEGELEKRAAFSCSGPGKKGGRGGEPAAGRKAGRLQFPAGDRSTGRNFVDQTTNAPSRLIVLSTRGGGRWSSVALRLRAILGNAGPGKRLEDKLDKEEATGTVEPNSGSRSDVLPAIARAALLGMWLPSALAPSLAELAGILLKLSSLSWHLLALPGRLAICR